jgi:hypothetical protein
MILTEKEKKMVTSVGGLLQTQGPGVQMIDSSDIKLIVSQTRSGQTGITALAGGGATGAPLLGAAINQISTVGTTNDSVLLPMALTGALVRVINAGANTLRVYAQTSNPNNNGVADGIVALAGGAAGTFTAVPANAVGEFWCPALGQWKSVNQ